MTKPVYYVGAPETCNMCDKPFNKIMYDARVPRAGSWANMCKSCFTGEQARTGTGYGQKYQKQEDGRWMKIGG